MQATAQRLLRLVALLQTRPLWSGAELADRMGVDRRSIRRDMERLRGLGYPVRASAGIGGGYQLGAGAPTLPLLLEEDEATTIAIALRAAAASVTGLEATAAAVLTKLDPLVPVRRRQQAGQVHAATATLGGGGLEGADARVLGILGRACRQAARATFEYRSHAGEVTRRDVQAQHLVNYGRRWYLLAWDNTREDWRTLRVDRMGEPQVQAGSGLHRRLPATPEAMVRHAVSRAPFELQAVLRLRGTVEALAARVPPWCGTLEQDGPEHCLLRMGAQTPGMLAGQMLGLELAIERVTLSPPELADQIQLQLERMGQLLAG